MNELAELRVRIAKAKGWHWENLILVSPNGLREPAHLNGYPDWLHDWTAAAELLEEMTSYSLHHIGGFLAILYPSTGVADMKTGRGTTMLEAICRAYLSIMESQT